MSTTAPNESASDVKDDLPPLNFGKDDELWVSLGKHQELSGYEEWLGLHAVDPELSLHIEGMQLVPVHIGYYLRNTRWKLTRLVTGDQQLLDAVEMGHDFKGNGKEETVLHFPKASADGLIVRSSNGVLNDTDILLRYPEAEISELSIGKIVQPQKKEPRYSERTKLAYFGTTSEWRKDITDNREKIDGEAGLLTPELRAYLSKYGSIVYESDPNRTNKLVIGIKHYHYLSDAEMHYLLCTDEIAPAMKQHQENVLLCTTGLLDQIDQDSILYYNPSLGGSGDVSEESLRDQLEWKDIFANPNNPLKRELVQRLTEGLQMTDREGRKRVENAITLPMAVANTISSKALKQNLLHRLHGKSLSIDEERRSDRLFDMQMFAQYARSIGSASDAAKLIKERCKIQVEKPARIITNHMAKTMKAGDIAVFEYQGTFFSSGYIPSNAQNDKSYEDYLKHLPNTQLVVVEINGFDEYHAEIHKPANALKKEKATVAAEQATCLTEAGETNELLFYSIYEWNKHKKGGDPKAEKIAFAIVQQTLQKMLDLKAKIKLKN